MSSIQIDLWIHEVCDKYLMRINTPRQIMLRPLYLLQLSRSETQMQIQFTLFMPQVKCNDLNCYCSINQKYFGKIINKSLIKV